MNRKLRGNLMLIRTALIWGTSFVAQKSGMDVIGPLAFNGIRTLIGGIVLVPDIKLMNRSKADNNKDGEMPDAQQKTP